jgi:hypothetical protein
LVLRQHPIQIPDKTEFLMFGFFSRSMSESTAKTANVSKKLSAVMKCDNCTLRGHKASKLAAITAKRKPNLLRHPMYNATIPVTDTPAAKRRAIRIATSILSPVVGDAANAASTTP